MSEPTLETVQDRLQKLLEQKKSLEAKIMQEQARMRERERKARTRKLIEYGGLVDLAGLLDVEPATVLGVFLDGALRLQAERGVEQHWQAAGKAVLAERMAERQRLNARKRGKPKPAARETNGMRAALAPEAGGA